jgi:Uma2 family endonuclease
MSAPQSERIRRQPGVPAAARRRFNPHAPLTDRLFLSLCRANPDLRLERTAVGEDALTPAKQKGFAPICPDFVNELRSPSDRLRDVRAKMREYRDQGTRLGWLIDPKRRVVEVYRARRRVEVLNAPTTLTGEDVLPGFVLALKGILI